MPDFISSRAVALLLSSQLKQWQRNWSQAVEGCAVSRTSVMPAYWAVPRLELRVKELVNAGHRQIGILPYFPLGGITDAIAVG